MSIIHKIKTDLKSARIAELEQALEQAREENG